MSRALFSTLGLLPLACGGAFSGTEEEGGSGSSGSAQGGSGGTRNTTAGTGGSKPIAGSSSGGSASGGSAGTACLDPQPAGNGYERCGAGPIHRPSVEECASSVPRPSTEIALPTEGQCTNDGDCADMPHGYCTMGVQVPGTVCAYGCVTDSECGPGSICVCGEPVGQCVGSTCLSDAV